MTMDPEKNGGGDQRGERPTVIGAPAWVTAGLYLVFVLMGAGAGLLVGPLADWLMTLPWAPLRGPAELVVGIPAPWLPLAGGAAGLALGVVAQYEQTTVRLSGDRVLLTNRGRELEFARDAVAVAFRDGSYLVLLGHGGGELARLECDLDRGRLARAFTEHDYTWADADPHADRFRRWVPDAPGLPSGANALLKARQKSLEKKGATDEDVRELREELARLGVVVRDEKRRQYWRTSGQTGAR